MIVNSIECSFLGSDYTHISLLHLSPGLNTLEPKFLSKLRDLLGTTFNTLILCQIDGAGDFFCPMIIVLSSAVAMQRAAMTQSALSKERRELREQQQRTLLEAIPKDLSRPWEDPLPEAGERHLAQV